MSRYDVRDDHREHDANCPQCEALLDQVEALKRENAILKAKLLDAREAMEYAVESMR